MGLLKDIWRHYGKDNQLDKLREECKELQMAVRKYQEFPNSIRNLNHMAEEIADVQIMIDQVKENMSLYDQVNDWTTFKFERIRKRIDEEKEEMQ